MRGASLAITIFSLVFFGAAPGQKVQFAPAEKSVVLQRMKAIPENNQDRASRLKQLFIQAGCGENFLTEQKLEGAETPNIVCRLGTGDNDVVIVGAHYERATSPQRPLDNWSGAALLPVLYQSLRERRRNHSFIFVAFADNGNNPTGAESFVRQMSRSQLEHVEAMVNLDALGLSPTKVWAAHSDKELVHDLIVMVYALKLPASQIDIARFGGTDSDPFAARRIPQITIHSLTQQNVASGADSQFRPNNYYDTYRLLCGYLAYLDQSLKSRPHSE
ncbi:MAG TPA: M28 family peptidase [Candidatus Angelobacter sp.]|nr:M28 family peptidase [Candidatus Angelobacter sp.]